MEIYDVAIIGGGPGGYVSAIRAAQYGKKVCLVEKHMLGGVCLNRGCIPTKTLVKSIEVISLIKNCSQYGVKDLDLSLASLDINKIQQRKRNIVSKLVSGIDYLLKANNVNMISGIASFKDKNTLNIRDRKIRAEHIIIATGSVPAELTIPITGDASIITSKEALDLKEVPKRIMIIGGGVVGVELAYVFSQLGAQVTLVEKLKQILPMVDKEIATEATRILKGFGVKIYTEAKVMRIDNDNVYYETDKGEETVEVDKIIISVGRIPNVHDLDIENIGLETNKHAIITDAHMRTNIPNIYAVGDVNGICMLAHVASMEGIVAVENICGNNISIDYTSVPQCIFLQPEIAMVGLTEIAAKEKYDNVKVGRFPIAANAKANIEGESKGIIKVIIEPKNNKILGAHILGLRATEIISEIALAMKLGATPEELTLTIHPHPTVSEIIPEAFNSSLNKPIHFT